MALFDLIKTKLSNSQPDSEKRPQVMTEVPVALPKDTHRKKPFWQVKRARGEGWSHYGGTAFERGGSDTTSSSFFGSSFDAGGFGSGDGGSCGGGDGGGGGGGGGDGGGGGGGSC